LYASRNVISDQVKEDEMAGHVAHIGEVRNAYSILVGEPAGRRPLGRPRRRWEGNIREDLKGYRTGR
jgi:hypothetical protein